MPLNLSYYVAPFFRRLAAGDRERPRSKIADTTPPLLAYFRKWQITLGAVAQQGPWTYQGMTLLVVIALTTQVVYLGWTRDWKDPWWRLAAAYAALMLVVDYVVWDGTPGAITRVVLPLTFGFNTLLRARAGGFWPWYVAGNLHLAAGFAMLADTLMGR